MRPSRRLGYRFHVAFAAGSGGLALAVDNHGTLGIHLQARSLTIPGAPYSYTVGAGDELRTTLPNPGTYDLSLHGPNGFFRRFGGSAETAISAESGRDARDGHLRLRLRLARRGLGNPVRIQLADAYGRDRQVELHGTREITIDTRDSGGWYDVTLTAPSDPSFTAEFAGRLETAALLTSDPQLGRASG